MSDAELLDAIEARREWIWGGWFWANQKGETCWTVAVGRQHNVWERSVNGLSLREALTRAVDLVDSLRVPAP